MKQKSGSGKAPAEQVLKGIRRQTRRQYSEEENIRIVLDGLRGEENISERGRREGIAASIYDGWSREFSEAGKRRLGAIPRELAVRFTDERKYFVSEASVYRLLKAHDLITSPVYMVIKAASKFKDKTTAITQLWRTDFTYLKITGWGR